MSDHEHRKHDKESSNETNTLLIKGRIEQLERETAFRLLLVFSPQTNST